MATAPILKMSTEIAEKIRQHGAETYPNECCGALLGRDGSETDHPQDRINQRRDW